MKGMFIDSAKSEFAKEVEKKDFSRDERREKWDLRGKR